MFCEYCGADNPPDATTCFACKRSLSAALDAAFKSACSAQLAPHTLLKQRYDILMPIGQGGFGSVYKARDTQAGNNLVAVKEINLGGLKPQEIIEATDGFNREVQTLSTLQHPNLPRMHDHFTDAEHWYMVMDFIEGVTLERHLELKAGKQSVWMPGLPLKELLSVGVQLCTVLGYLHTLTPTIIFRDLKPANIMLTPTGRAYLIDFGIARHFKPGQARDTMPFGSPGYAAPEQYGKAQTTPQADIYSLGAILHQMATGSDPSASPFRFTPILPPPDATNVEQRMLQQLNDLVVQMVDMDPQRRPESMERVKQELRKIADQQMSHWGYAAMSQPQSAPSISTAYYTPPSASGPAQGGAGGQTLHPPLQKPARPKRGTTRRQVLASLAVVGAMTALGGMVYGGIVQFHQRESSQPYTFATPLSAPDYSFSGPSDYMGHTGAVNALAWNGADTLFASASNDTTVRVWHPYNDGIQLVYKGHKQAVTSLSWQILDLRIASGSLDQTVQVWDALSGKLFASQYFPAAVNAVVWAAGAARLAVGCDDGKVYSCNSKTLKPSATYTGHSASVRALAASPGNPDYTNAYIASAGDDYTVQVWSAFNGMHLYTYFGHGNTVNAVSWSPDGRRIASASSDHTVQVWDALTGENVLTYEGHITDGGSATSVADVSKPPAKVNAVAWHPNGTLIASGTSNGEIQVWDAVTGNLQTEILLDSSAIKALAWSHDGRYLIYGGDDKLVDMSELLASLQDGS
jgi:serine/threonine protein kinase